MVDALLFAVERARVGGFRNRVGAADGRAIVVTLHRPSNVDDPDRLSAIMSSLRAVAKTRPVIFPAHPRTRTRLEAAGIDPGTVRLLDPVSYMEMVDLVDAAFALVTDSGGLQVESAALGVPCLTLRAVTEWPETIASGANRLVPDPSNLAAAIEEVQRPKHAGEGRPDGWDGMAAVRIVELLRSR
jgi:UDP-N-acetylglucosamine 2-epimerase (non-hydrolysing)